MIPKYENFITNFYSNSSEIEAGFRESQENDKIDLKYGFDRVKDNKERTGYLINMHSVCPFIVVWKRFRCVEQRYHFRPIF